MREEDSHKLYLLGTGDQAVMAAVFDQWSMRVKQYIRNRMGKGVDADELTHQAFVKLYIHARRSRGFYARFDNIGQFLVVLTSGVVRDHLRRKKLDEKHEAILKSLPAVVARRPDAEVLGKELFVRAKKGLWGLSKKARRCVELHLFHSYSVEETSVLTGIREGTVRTHLHRARVQLRAALGSDYDKGDNE